MKKIEICCYTLEDAQIAEKAGADRIELCSGRNEGGLTPSYGQLIAVREQINIPVHSIIRPRGGDFCYSQSDLKVIKNDLSLIKELGFAGVVIGMLKPNGQIDVERLKQLIKLVDGLSITFHRAFDVCCDPYLALKQLTDLGINRILTSGQKANAVEGLPLILELSQLSQGTIIMPGCGIRANNIKLFNHPLIHEIHTSASTAVASKMIYQNTDVNMSQNPTDEYLNYQVDPHIVKKIKTHLINN
ncbi:copper homeostasis protein CutC [Orbaceae bacterium ac157xtp]